MFLILYTARLQLSTKVRFKYFFIISYYSWQAIFSVSLSLFLNVKNSNCLYFQTRFILTHHILKYMYKYIHIYNIHAVMLFRYNGIVEELHCPSKTWDCKVLRDYQEFITSSASVAAVMVVRSISYC
jgi:hypothetical protein